MKFPTAKRDQTRCDNCGYCETAVNCPGEDRCTGCGSCIAACPREAKELVVSDETRPEVKLHIDGQTVIAPAGITLLAALEQAGYSSATFPGEACITAPCRTGGCWACAVLVDGEMKPSCIAPVTDGMAVETDPARLTHREPQRLVFGFSGHMVGGVGTPWEAKSGRGGWVEVACFAAGCILRCPTCQNWETTFRSQGEPMTPELAAIFLSRARQRYEVNRMAISGGESTLNRRWLVEFLHHLKDLNPDSAARLHVDTNSVYLTPDYVHELIQAGMTDIGCDLKALELPTFQKISGLKNEEFASRLLVQAWAAVEYLLTELWGQVFVGIGLPYNAALISSEEIAAIGARLAALQPEVQVTVLDYRPEFRRQDLTRPSTAEMMGVKRLLERTGLKKVICQTYRGHVGPD